MVGAPPPPPPPPPPPAPTTGKGGGGEDVAAALFASINALGSEGARAGLKKATRGPVNTDAPAPAASSATKPAVVAGVTSRKTYPPKCELSGNKWAVEHQEGNKELAVEVTSIKQSVYVYKCVKSTLRIKGKPNSICIDACTKVDVVFENALSTCDIVNSKDIQVQCTGMAPSINIDGCVAVTCYLSAESKETAHIITSKSAAINLIIPTGDDDIKETPIPEQFLTKFVNGDWVTEAVSHDD